MFAMSVQRADYDSDPERWGAWTAPTDVHDIVAPSLHGPVLDIGCGEGRLASRLNPGVRWIGVDSSPTQLAANAYRPVVLADMRALPFRSGVVAEVTHLWCLYHVDDPAAAVADAARVLRSGGRYFACTSARNNDPELMPEGYPLSPFDAEEAADIVASVFNVVEAESWDQPFFPLATREEVRAYCRHHSIPEQRADMAEIPLWLTKRGVLLTATKT